MSLYTNAVGKTQLVSGYDHANPRHVADAHAVLQKGVPVGIPHGAFHAPVLGDKSGLHVSIIQDMKPVTILPVNLQAEVGFQQLPHHLDNLWDDSCACMSPMPNMLRKLDLYCFSGRLCRIAFSTRHSRTHICRVEFGTAFKCCSKCLQQRSFYLDK